MNIGDQRQIQFRSSTKGIGILTLEIEKIENNSIHFKVMSDNTHIGSWLSWRHIRINIDQKDVKSTVTWTSDYTCNLGPQWYFEPIEKYAVNLMNEYLVQSYFGR